MRLIIVGTTFPFWGFPVGCVEPMTVEQSAYNGEDTPILCRDGKDNDGDGRVDCDDPDCRSLYTCADEDTDTLVDSSQDSDVESWTRIPAVTFNMGTNGGDPAEAPEHVVYLRAFEMMRTEVTVARYQACVEAGACDALSPSAYCASEEYQALIEEDSAQYPMNCVSWEQAKAFCEWVGARLPTEAEWEGVARNSKRGSLFPWGDDPPTCESAVIDDGTFDATGSGCGLGRPWPVCSKDAGNNSEGDVCDLIGNVQEWVEDDVHLDYIDAPGKSEAWIDDPRTDGRVVRGGAYYDGPDISASSRRFCSPEEGCNISEEMDGFGFRCAR